jgi:hypothetical protein
MGGAARLAPARNPSLFSEQASSRFFEKEAGPPVRAQKTFAPCCRWPCHVMPREGGASTLPFLKPYHNRGVTLATP